MPSRSTLHICASCRQTARLHLLSKTISQSHAVQRWLSYTNAERSRSTQDTLQERSDDVPYNPLGTVPQTSQIGRYSRKPLNTEQEGTASSRLTAKTLLSQLEQENLTEPEPSVVVRRIKFRTTGKPPRVNNHKVQLWELQDQSGVAPAVEWSDKLARQVIETPRDRLPEDVQVAKHITRMSRAAERYDSALADSLHAAVLEHVKQGISSGNAVALFEQLALMYGKMSLFDRAYSLIGDMQQADMQPTLKLWTSLIKASARHADRRSVDQCWYAMLDQGIRPDTAAWTAKIYALCFKGRTKDAMTDMRQMSLFKEQPPTPQQHNPPNSASKALHPAQVYISPTVEVGNAAIAALAAKKTPERRSYIHKVLLWMKKHELTLDINTYNPLLDYAVELGEIREVFDILERMRRDGLDLDARSGMLLMKALFNSGFLDDFSGEEQSNQLLALIEDIEQNHIRIKLDEHAYGVAIFNMLTKYDNPYAVEQLLSRGRENNIAMTQHVYTMMMNHHLSAATLDYAAFEALWYKIKFANGLWGANLDAVFFDRALELLCQHHNELGVEKILEILNHLPRMALRPSWPALLSVAHMFEARGDRARLAALVQNIRNSSYVMPRDDHSGYGHGAFWDYIFDTGILREEGLTSFRQVWEKDRNRKTAAVTAHIDIT